MDSHAVWQGVLGEIEVTVSSSSFTAWFKNTKLEIISDKEVLIIAPNIFARTQLEKRFHPQILEALAHNGINAPSISYNVESSNKKPRVNREVDKSGQKEPAKPLILPSRKSHSSNLNPRYTFDNFIVGSSNDLAYAACQAVAAHPGEKYNPLYLYGGSGLGKTHLMQAVGNEIVKKQPSARVLYITTETFVNEFLDSIRFKKKGFSDKYRNVDVLIVDDMQFIAGKEKTQDEFFHTFNDLHQNNKQIIISSDKPPKSIPTLTDRLRSRFEWGMAIDIQMPDYETRCAIVKAKAELSNTELDSDVVEYLATNFKTNIRELEGALNRLLAYAEMQNFTPDLAAAEGILGDIKRNRPQHITAKQIIDKTARYYNIDVKDMCSSRRDKFIAMPRQKSDYQTTLGTLAAAYKRFPSGTYLIWYPCLPRDESRHFPAQLNQHFGDNYLRAELHVRAENGAHGMYGSGMYLINPPYTLPAELETTLPALRDLCAESADNRIILDARIP